MAYFGIAMILAIAYLIDWLEKKSSEKYNAKIEDTHKQMYDLIDGHFSGREARERKAKVDAMIGAISKGNGRDYKPEHLKQVTTVEERKGLVKAELNNTANDDALTKAQILDALDAGFGCPNNVDDWYYEEHSQAEKRERLVQYYMNAGIERNKAEASADEFFGFAKGM